MRSKAVPVSLPGVADLAEGLDRALRRSDTGIGLALPQLGISLRGFILSAKLFHPAKTRFVFNPEILELLGEVVESCEGCLSLPGEEYTVHRHNWVRVRYSDQKGRTIEETLEGLAAKAFQHEFDHLEGVLISEKAITPAPKPKPKPTGLPAAIFMATLYP